jgi:glycogen debranching enzyme
MMLHIQEDAMDFDIRHVPFSRFGSYIAFSLLQGDRHKKTALKPGLWLRCLHGDAAREVFQVRVLSGGRPVRFTPHAAPSVLTLRAKGGSIRICIAERDVVRIHGKGLGLRLTQRPGGFNCALPHRGARWVVNAATAFRNYVLVPLRGALQVDAPWEVARCTHVVADFLPDPRTRVMEGAVEQVVGAPQARTHRRSFDSCVRSVEREFETFVRRTASVPEAVAATARLAAYVNWASVVDAHGLFKRPAMFMSKNWMSNVWSWDHCFNAMALSYRNPRLAWDQFMVLFDHQLDSGQIPDFLNDILKLYNFVKPPVHGWALGNMLRNNRWLRDPVRLREVYPRLSRWTDWWFTCRDPDGSGLPQYHHGNDSGWDNGTVFDAGFPVRGADLAAFLVVQMDALADIAARLGRKKEAAAWKKRADGTLDKLLSRLWTGEQFVCPHAATGKTARASDSIFSCLPIILGDRLPGEVSQRVADDIRRHLTRWGPATEHVDSPLYRANGYWRGPIWAPPALILADGLRRAGHDALARDVAARFCALVAKSGMAENFDARTGRPLCDRAYTWTSSAFLVLAHEFL